MGLGLIGLASCSKSKSCSSFFKTHPTSNCLACLILVAWLLASSWPVLFSRQDLSSLLTSFPSSWKGFILESKSWRQSLFEFGASGSVSYCLSSFVRGGFGCLPSWMISPFSCKRKEETVGEIFYQPMIYWHEEWKLERSLFMKRVKTNHFIKRPYHSKVEYNEAHRFI